MPEHRGPTPATLAAAGVAAVAAFGAYRWWTARPRPGHPYLAGSPLLIAHRGGAGVAPENTLLAFRRAVDWWRADLLEIDVRPTRDGEVVVIHDATVDRTTDGRGAVVRLSLSEVQALDAGYRFTRDGGASFPFRGEGTRIPTLAEVLRELPGARVNVEIKDGRAQERVWEVVQEAGAAARVLIAAERRANRSLFDRRRYPGPTSASREELVAFYLHHLARATALYHPSVDAFQMPERYAGRQVLSRRFVREAHAHNVAVHVWTVNDEADMRRLLEWGVDGVVTDRPDRLARLLHEIADRSLPPGPEAGHAPS